MVTDSDSNSLQFTMAVLSKLQLRAHDGVVDYWDSVDPMIAAIGCSHELYDVALERLEDSGHITMSTIYERLVIRLR